MVSIIASKRELGPGSENNDPVLEPLGRRAIMHRPTASIEQCGTNQFQEIERG